MRIIIATDAWEPQVNGVARTLKHTKVELEGMGHEVIVIHPGLFSTIPCPFSKDVRLTLWVSRQVMKVIQPPCAVHIATEGPIGLAFRWYCMKHRIPFTTAYHTKFPEYLKEHTGIPVWMTTSLIRWFHRPSKAVMVATHSLRRTVKSMGFKPPLKMWSRGVSYDQFYPRPKSMTCDLPIGLFVGRVSREKNIEAFLKLQGIYKVVVGEGPEQERLRYEYPDAHFTGVLHGEELAQMYCNADVFVFPSKTDTFGLVVLESLACGIPVACYPVEGPGEIIGDISGVGKTDWDLQVAVDQALKNHSAQACLELASRYSWRACTEQFVNNLVVYST